MRNCLCRLDETIENTFEGKNCIRDKQVALPIDSCQQLIAALCVSQVSKEEYETCRITNPNPRVIAVCNNPYKTMYFTITFRPFTPQPEGLEFLPGHDYYFISTSSKDDLHKRIGGRCTSNNMKVVFKVCCRNEADTSSSSATSRNNCEYSSYCYKDHRSVSNIDFSYSCQCKIYDYKVCKKKRKKTIRSVCKYFHVSVQLTIIP